MFVDVHRRELLPRPVKRVAGGGRRVGSRDGEETERERATAAGKSPPAGLKRVDLRGFTAVPTASAESNVEEEHELLSARPPQEGV
ncbi:hypothetical protein [Halogeometricum luteum]|uniref:Uncharacterized protein n=1 Tax=Halogeometricum luteum TaxID=2950537 RepID=A0ABU2FWN0_9EURY|nr:hypothetical protein [Halogeometricum sp. S3BR5-2]MDS0292951.1 hypothetical protein [Halogeometricum sp. S3BR5-2]